MSSKHLIEGIRRREHGTQQRKAHERERRVREAATRRANWMLVTRAICHTHLDRRREAHDQVDDRQHRSLVAAVSTLRQRVFDSSVAADACPGPSTASWAERVSTSEGFAFCLETSAPGPKVCFCCEQGVGEFRKLRAVKASGASPCMCTMLLLIVCPSAGLRGV